jgi:hypothetical protein
LRRRIPHLTGPLVDHPDHATAKFRWRAAHLVISEQIARPRSLRWSSRAATSASRLLTRTGSPGWRASDTAGARSAIRDATGHRALARRSPHLDQRANSFWISGSERSPLRISRAGTAASTRLLMFVRTGWGVRGGRVVGKRVAPRGHHRGLSTTFPISRRAREEGTQPLNVYGSEGLGRRECGSLRPR